MSHLIISVANHVGRITLNRPEVRNAFNDDVIAELTQAFQDMGSRPDVRCIVLAAEGSAFCAGADLNWMRRMADYSYNENLEDAGKLATMLHTIAACPKPTIAAVQGDVYAGGTGLVAVCDMAVAVESAQFCISEVKIGLAPATISPYLIRAMGVRAAQRYWLTADRFSASKAQAMGLVTEVVAVDALQASVDKLCQALCLASPEALRATKRLIEAVVERPITHELIAHTVKEIAVARTTSEGREGVQAFLQKRLPSWIPHN
jgi:methylglutaconyl-CoA hydratase